MFVLKYWLCFKYCAELSIELPILHKMIFVSTAVRCSIFFLPLRHSQHIQIPSIYSTTVIYPCKLFLFLFAQMFVLSTIIPLCTFFLLEYPLYWMLDGEYWADGIIGLQSVATDQPWQFWKLYLYFVQNEICICIHCTHWHELGASCRGSVLGPEQLDPRQSGLVWPPLAIFLHQRRCLWVYWG